MTDIPTFNGAKFSGEKPKSDETLLKIMEVLKIPHESRARILKVEKETDKQVRKKMKNSCDLIDKAVLDSKQEKTLLNKFNRLFREMKANGKDNGNELCVILDKLRNSGVLDEESSRTVFNAMGDIYDKSVFGKI